MTSVKEYAQTLDIDDFEPKHMGYLLGRATERMRHDMTALAEALGERREKYSGLTGGYFRAVSIVPEGGARVTDLARVARMTKQAFGQYADVLEERGFLLSRPTESDRRVRWITRTEAGDQMVADTNLLYRRLDQRWKRQVGAERWDVFREVLVDLAVGWE